MWSDTLLLIWTYETVVFGFRHHRNPCFNNVNVNVVLDFDLVPHSRELKLPDVVEDNKSH